MVSAVSAICGKRPDAVLGKPSRGFLEIVRSREPSLDSWDIMVVGDRLDNDIAPAKRLGMRTVRILQGYGALSRPRNGWEEPEETVRTLAELPGLFSEDKGETE